MEISAVIFSTRDEVTGSGHLLDYILDKTGMKGTGRWTVQEGAERNTAIPTMAAALDARNLSGRKEERVAASSVLQGPPEIPNVEKAQIIEDAKHALYASKICSYAQGMCLIRAASDEMKWGVDVGECARIWKGGCIIRAALLDRIKSAFVRDPDLPNLMVDPDFAAELNRRQPSWRRIVTLAVASGIACPSLSSSLGYFDSYRRERLPANLTQVQCYTLRELLKSADSVFCGCDRHRGTFLVDIALSAPTARAPITPGTTIYEVATFAISVNKLFSSFVFGVIGGRPLTRTSETCLAVLPVTCNGYHTPARTAGLSGAMCSHFDEVF